MADFRQLRDDIKTVDAELAKLKESVEKAHRNSLDEHQVNSYSAVSKETTMAKREARLSTRAELLDYSLQLEAHYREQEAMRERQDDLREAMREPGFIESAMVDE